ncbi:SRPBCC domain-containing protein [Kribbella sp. NPDC026611]|uniref:SRPBCC domain-containing protein n=1 Tax=Kribbella sp. NPDC026611 TaxID=3154911 RepID=UPI0033E85806
MSENLTCSYVTYLRSDADTVWHALTDADVTAQWWERNESDWQVGSTWQHGANGSGTVLESDPPKRLVLTFPTDVPSQLAFDLEQHQDIVRLTMTHQKLADQNVCDIVAGVWPALLANLKTLVETGQLLPQSPLEMLPAK